FPLTIAAPEVSETEETQVASESYDFGSETKTEPIAAESELQAPKFNSDLFGARGESYSEEPASGGSKKGLWIGAIAATVLLAAGGGWWYMQQNGQAAAASGGSPIVSQTNQQPATQPQVQQNIQTSSLPQTQPQSQNAAAFSNPAPVNPASSNSKTQSVT